MLYGNKAPKQRIQYNMTAHISDREMQILHMVAYEKTSQEIAEELFISSHTAISHRKHLMEKLSVKNTAGLVRRGFELGYLSLPVTPLYDHITNS